MFLSRIGILVQVVVLLIVALIIALVVYHFTSSPQPVQAPNAAVIVHIHRFASAGG